MSADLGRNKLLLNENTLKIAKGAFYYGCFTVKHFEEQGISKSTYNRCKDFLLHVFQDRIEEINVPHSRTRMLRLKNDQFEDSCNLLLDLFTYQPASSIEIVTFLSVLRVFTVAAPETSYTFENINKPISHICEDRRTFKKKLHTLVDRGYLLCERRDKRSFQYRLAPVIFDRLDESALYRLNALVDLCKCIYHPATCGRYLLDTLAFFNQQKSVNYETIFFCKHMHMGQVFDDAALWKLMTAIYEKKIISFTVNGKSYRFQQPCRIIINESDGRRYLYSIGLDTYTKNGKMHRIDQISGIKEEKHTDEISVFSSEEADRRYHNSTQGSFNGISMPRKKRETAVLVYKKESYPEIQRHFPDAVPEVYDDDHDQVQITVNSLKDIKPWLRLHLGEIRLHSTSNDVKDEFEKEMAEWRAMYGIV